MKGSRLHLDHFKVFRDLARTRSFSKAAAANYLTQSAVSQQAAFLERRLGRRLINRGRGRFALTAEGRAFLEGCEKVLEAYQDALERIRGAPSEISGPLKIETVYSIGLFELAPYARSFMKCHPRVDLRLEFQRSDRIYSDVLSGSCDLGVVACPWPHPAARIIPFREERLALAAPPGHPLARRRSIGIRELHGLEYVAFDKDIPTRRAIDAVLRRHGVAVNVVHEFDNIELLKRAVEVGAGVSILPENAVMQEVGSKSIACSRLAEGPFYRKTGVILDRRKGLSRAAREFVRWLGRD